MNNTSDVKKIVWDLDGTLFDTWKIHLEAIRTVYTKLYAERLSALKIIKKQKLTLLDTIENIFEENFENAFLQYQQEFIHSVVSGNLIDKINIVEKLHNLLAEDSVMYILTGRDKKTTEEIINYFNLSDVFTDIISINEQHLSKKEILSRYNENFQEFVYMTDSKTELEELKDCFKDIKLVKWFESEMEEN